MTIPCIEIINKTSISNDTKVFYVSDSSITGGNRTELKYIEKITILPLTMGSVIKADIRFVGVALDIQTRNILQSMHNQNEMKRLGLKRIN